MSSLIKYYSYTPWLLYDGTNGADVVATFNSYTVQTAGCAASLISDKNGVAVVHFTDLYFAGSGSSRDITLTAGNCIPISNDPWMTPSSGLDLFGARDVAIKYGGHGVAVLGALPVGITNIPVPIKPAQPDLGYVASAFLDGTALALGTVTLGLPVKTSTSVVTVPVINAGLLTVTLAQATVTVDITAPQVQVSAAA
jgi:hypothetical protein